MILTIGKLLIGFAEGKYTESQAQQGYKKLTSQNVFDLIQWVEDVQSEYSYYNEKDELVEDSENWEKWEKVHESLLKEFKKRNVGAR